MMTGGNEPPRDRDVQWGPGAADALEEIYDRADAVVGEAERWTERTDPADPEAWPLVHSELQAVAVRLSHECFFDGTLGPGTATVDPGPYLGRIRAAYRFEEASFAAPKPLDERIGLAARVGAAVGWTRLRVRVAGGERWVEETHVGEADALAERIGRHPPSSDLLRIDLAPLGIDREQKWVGHGVPAVELVGGTLTVDGPPCLGTVVEAALEDGSA